MPTTSDSKPITDHSRYQTHSAQWGGGRTNNPTPVEKWREIGRRIADGDRLNDEQLRMAYNALGSASEILYGADVWRECSSWMLRKALDFAEIQARRKAKDESPQSEQGGAR